MAGFNVSTVLRALGDRKGKKKEKDAHQKQQLEMDPVGITKEFTTPPRLIEGKHVGDAMMDCVHCHKRFSKDAFGAHCREHAEIQTKLNRPAGRKYGARYDPDNQQIHVQNPSAKEPNTQIQNASSRPVVAYSGADGSSNRLLPEDTTPSHHEAPAGLDGRIRFIIESFPPYDGDGVEAPWPPSGEFACKDCDLKFRTKNECDEHYLSQYCHGGSIVFYTLTVDESKPRGYRVEKEIQPLDGIKVPSEIQCRKCYCTFSSEAEMENHQKTHLLSPSKCLHCNKMFSTGYELEDHYDWHDDMDYRQRMDNLEITRAARASKAKGGNDEGRARFKDGELGGISFISAEDLERNLAPRGYYEGQTTKYVHARPDGTVVSEVLDMPTPGPEFGPGLPMIGHGKPGYALFVDVCGRRRWMASARVEGDYLQDTTSVASLIQAARELESQGQLLEAIDSYIQGLDELSQLDLDSREDLKLFMLVKVSELASRLKLFEVGVEYSIRALELSVKMFGRDSIDCFYRINDLGVLFDEHGLLNDAGHLYRRSLFGRLRVNGPDHADTLMTMQELASVNQKLGNVDAARTLLEKSYIGQENLQESPNEATTMMRLNNTAATYTKLGETGTAVRLWKSCVPRMGRSLGPGHKTTCVSVRNLLKFMNEDETTVDAEIQDVLSSMQEEKNMSDLTFPALQDYADFLAKNRRFEDAVALYRHLFNWGMKKNRNNTSRGSPDDNTIHCLHCLACCLNFLQRVPEAKQAFQQLDELTAQSRSAVDNDNMRKMALAAKRERVEAEAKSWGLDKPGRCACGNMTRRRCSICRMKPSCSSDCTQSRDKHTNCYPSVTPQESISMARQPLHMDELEAMFRETLAHDPNVTPRRAAAAARKLVSSEGFFVNPAGFATFRVWKDPTKLVSFYFPKADTRIAIGNNSNLVQWNSSDHMRSIVLYTSTEEQEDIYLLVAPGEGMYQSIQDEQRSTTGVRSDDGEFPDLDMIEYLQSKEPRSMEMELVAVMMVWE